MGALEGFGGAESADDVGNIALAGIDFGVEAAHVGGGDFAGEVRESRRELRVASERVLANDGDGVISREVVKIVLKRDEVEGVDEAVGGVAGDHIDFFFSERAVNQAEVHDAGLRGEMQAVALGPAGEAVGAFEKFVADSDAHARREGSEVGGAAEIVALSLLAADNHGEGVVEAERLRELQMEAASVFGFDAIVDGGGIAGGRFVEDGGEGGAGVLDVEVEFAGEESLLAEQGAAEIGFALDVKAGAGLDVLGEKLGEDDLFGEEFGADDDLRFVRATGGGKEQNRGNAETGECREEATLHLFNFSCERTEEKEEAARRVRTTEGTENVVNGSGLTSITFAVNGWSRAALLHSLKNPGPWRRSTTHA